MFCQAPVKGSGRSVAFVDRLSGEVNDHVAVLAQFIKNGLFSKTVHSYLKVQSGGEKNIRTFLP